MSQRKNARENPFLNLFPVRQCPGLQNESSNNQLISELLLVSHFAAHNLVLLTLFQGCQMTNKLCMNQATKETYIFCCST